MRFRAFRFISFISTVLLIGWLFSSHKEPINQDSATISGARQALDLMNHIRAYPNETLPESGFVSAFYLVQQKVQKSAVFDPQTWEAIGPQNIGGRTLALVFNPQNPNTVYAGAASGGLWRSYSGGEGENAWEYVATGFPVLGVSSIAIAPDDSNTIYIGTGEVYGSDDSFPGVVGDRTTRGSYGIGILKTTDSGQTWFKSLDWTFDQKRAVQKLRLDPLDARTIWAATTEGTLISRNGGENWQKVLDVVMATDIAINPNNSDIVFVACGGMGSPGHGIYRTTDGGESWQKMHLGPNGPETFQGKAMLSISPSSPNIVYASIGRSSGALFTNEPTATWLLKTTDSGDSWSVVSTVDYARIQGWYSHDVAVNPTNPDEVWCGGQSFSPFLSIRGGEDLQPAETFGFFQPDPETMDRGLSHSWADFHQIVFHPTDPQIIYFANDGGVFRTTDRGRTVANLNLGYQTTQFYNGLSNSNRDSLFSLGGMQDNSSAAYEGDVNWRRLGGGDGSWTAIDQSNDNVIYISYQFLTILKHTNRGRVGESQEITPPRNSAATNFIAPYILSPVDNQTIYAGSNVVFKSIDAGLSWLPTNNDTPLDGNPVLSLAGSHQDANMVYAATSAAVTRSNVFRTEDGGLSWQKITGDLPDRIPTDLSVDANSDQNVFIAFGGFGASHVFKSTDGGDNWVDIGADLPDVPTWSVVVDPAFPNHIYVGNDLGVFRSTDGGASWENFSLGLPDAVIAMDLSISLANRKLRVATHGNGVYEIQLTRTPTTGVAEREDSVPQTPVLQQNFPNPFNVETRIRYFLDQDERVALTVYNALGQMIRNLVSENQQQGWHDQIWDGKDDSGKVVSSGLYIYRLKTSDSVLSRKMLVLK